MPLTKTGARAQVLHNNSNTSERVEPQEFEDNSVECLFCGISCPPYFQPATLQCVKEVPQAPSVDDPLVERNLFSLFLAFNILEAPPKLCERLLTWAGNPDKWFSCCQTCLYLSKQGMSALIEVQALRRSFNAIKARLREKVKAHLERADPNDSKNDQVLHQLRSCVLRPGIFYHIYRQSCLNLSV